MITKHVYLFIADAVHVVFSKLPEFVRGKLITESPLNLAPPICEIERKIKTKKNIDIFQI